MTQSEIKMVLGGYLRAKRTYERINRELEECETMITSLQVDYSRERVQITHDPDRLANVVDKLSALRQRCIEQAGQMVRQMAAVKRIIDGVASPTEQEMLSRRYIMGQRWEQIAAEMAYSWRGIHALHSRALERLCRAQNRPEKNL